MADAIIAKVAVENTVYHFDKAFDYLVPESLLPAICAGLRVMVPFGAGNNKRQGMILELSRQPAANHLKSIAAVLDKAPLLNSEMLLLVTWLKERYFCTLFDAVKLLLPTGINLKMKTQYQLVYQLADLKQSDFTETQWQIFCYLEARKAPIERVKLLKDLQLTAEDTILEKLCKDGFLSKTDGFVRQVGDAVEKMVRLAEESAVQPKLTPKQKDIVNILSDVGTASLKELCYFAGVTVSVVNTLVTKGIVEYYECEIYRNPYDDVKDSDHQETITLSDEQQAAFDRLHKQYSDGSGGVSLLYGVTGSGKTSVFMRLIDDVYPSGRGVIVMVPEISLTPQTISLFHQRYGRSVAVFHSGLSLAQRMDEWKRVKNGEAHIAVGTRSAVFAPFDDIGLIIMDEEQEYTYKSESSPRYHARDVAKFRCAYHKALLVLSSATPSVESYYFAANGRYSLNKLTARYGEAVLPNVTIVDMNEELEKGNTSILSTTLLEALNDNIDCRKQSIVLLNRRGYNTFASCKSCGHVITCPNCSISMTYHTANNRLMCHYCGFSVPFTQECPECHEHSVHYSGFGTQRAEQELQELLPDARILRLDTDTTMTRFAYEKKLRLFSQGEYDIIIGTQMVAKGLDFENVTLVGVLSADQSLYSDDFRSSERAFDLLTQVVGRAGRGKFEGNAMIQTFTPENAIIQLAAEQNYQAFYDNEIKFRKMMLYPPFVDIIVVGFVGANESKVRNASNTFLGLLSKLAKSDYSDLPMRVLNPSPALIAKVSNKYRYKIIIKCRNDRRFRGMLSQLLLSFSSLRDYAAVTVFADCNPDIIM
ncbi:MAG TPA: primosomal protein N' [Oscillospiraceae bacterium]|nr:primosomal protein N' [Oscillospiraceae bacterium]